jgi:transcriptional regulator with XRE-family HTH domain
MHHTLFQTVRNAFYNANLANGLTQKALAEQIGVSKQMVSKWLKEEKSFATISLHNLQKICHVLDLELETKQRLNVKLMLADL